jgi:hypothetical protein
MMERRHEIRVSEAELDYLRRLLSRDETLAMQYSPSFGQEIGLSKVDRRR